MVDYRKLPGLLNVKKPSPVIAMKNTMNYDILILNFMGSWLSLAAPKVF